MVANKYAFLQITRRRFLFFFQAEDGIRDRNVTGVQTCALPIFRPSWPQSRRICVWRLGGPVRRRGDCGQDGRTDGQRSRVFVRAAHVRATAGVVERSEERRVGKEWRWWGGGWREKGRRREGGGG